MTLLTVLLAIAASQQDPATDQAPEQGGRLELTCVGGGSANKLDVINGSSSGTESGMVFGSDGSSASYQGSSDASGTVYVPRAQGFEDQVDLYIERGEGRMRVPRIMLPPIRGGENGWFKIKNVKVEPNEITASVAINVVNNPKLRIDRMTGVINLSGKACDFVGRCSKLNPAKVERQF